MRRLILAGFAFLLFAATAHAQLPTKGDAYFGYSYLRTGAVSLNVPSIFASQSVAPSNLNGWNGSVEFKLLPWVGGVADFGGNYGTERVVPFCGMNIPCVAPFNVSGSVHSFLVGPRVAVSVGKVTPFVHGLIGGARTSASKSGFSVSDTSFSSAVGGGLDYRLVRGIAWRVQADDLRTSFFSGTQHNFRFSTGLVLHF